MYRLSLNFYQPKNEHLLKYSSRIVTSGIFILLTLMNINYTSAAESDPLLDSLIGVALSQHPDLESMTQMIEATKAERSMANGWMNPELRLELMDLPENLRYNEDPATAFQIGVSQQIPWKGKRASAGAAVNARLEGERQGLEASRQEMAAMVAMAYYELAALEEEKILLEEGLVRNREMAKSAGWMAGSAMGKLSDMDRAQLEEENWKLKIVAVNGGIKRQRATLSYLTGIDIDTVSLASARLPDGLPSLPVLDSLLLPEVLDSVPVMKEVLAGSMAADNELNSARLDWYPDVELMLSYAIKPDLKTDGGVDHTGQPLPSGTFDQMDMISVGVAFPLPLWSNGNQRAKISEKQAMKRVAITQIAKTRLQLINEIRQLHASWEEENNCCAFVGETIIGRAESLYRTTLIDYQSGKSSFMELSQARMSLLMAKMELSMSRGRAWNARAMLHAKLGILVPSSSEVSR